MDLLTVVIFVALVLAALGTWVLVSFLFYRRFFGKVNAVLSRMRIGSLNTMPTDEFMRYADVIKRSYFAKKSVDEAVADVLDESATDRFQNARKGT